jgi:hypothetical protein
LQEDRVIHRGHQRDGVVRHLGINFFINIGCGKAVSDETDANGRPVAVDGLHCKRLSGGRFTLSCEKEIMGSVVKGEGVVVE